MSKAKERPLLKTEATTVHARLDQIEIRLVVLQKTIGEDRIRALAREEMNKRLEYVERQIQVAQKVLERLMKVSDSIRREVNESI